MKSLLRVRLKWVFIASLLALIFHPQSALLQQVVEQAIAGKADFRTGVSSISASPAEARSLHRTQYWLLPSYMDWNSASNALQDALVTATPARPSPGNDAERVRFNPPTGPLGEPPPIPDADTTVQLGGTNWARDRIGDIINYTSNVDCGASFGVIGTIEFDYYLWKGNSSGDVDPNNIGGAVLWGGFERTQPCNPPGNWVWGWVQIISASTPAGIWGADPDQWYVDSGNRNDPDFLYYVAGYTAGFQDWPQRLLVAPEDTWHAELALVCKNVAEKEMKVLGSLKWGFKITAAGGMLEDPPYGSPGGWGAASDNFCTTVLYDWPSQDDYSDWTCERGCCCEETQGSLQFSSPQWAGYENSGSASIYVSRSGSGAGAVGVSYSTGGGNATPGYDYYPTSGTLSWPDGDTSQKSFAVEIINDGSDEDAETVNLQLSGPTGGATLGDPSSSVLTIVDDDVPPHSRSYPTLSQWVLILLAVSVGVYFVWILIRRKEEAAG